ncbi:surface lipoprotein assembly modifier [Xinfangfangia sp. CPCC 101601]|uniref:Surface lipoprotein assembly modifier n=1 Tax=Pseudogemmobacter lacusdianii TaxID=3069608 RepID=A0ABU0VXU7_9RHOB|nr:surface lipoprotein assembly modifier [Xinfangfangia sp. CPCC 101601]MDQ2065730.1 surface lipoprotein assembly modifier [Xinfangfangia sp. CPCC 101601]
MFPAAAEARSGAGERAALAAEAEAALAAGEIELARLLALAVVEDEPRNSRALAVLAAVGLSQQEAEAARVVAKRAFRFGKTELERFTAARLAAKASADLDQFTASKYWLRRALHLVPSEEARSATLRDYQTLRQGSRVVVDLGFSIKPSSNVNSGAEDALLTVDGVPTWFYFDRSSMALSGGEATAKVALRYRLKESATALTTLGFSISARGVVLSDEARAAAPAARGLDFAHMAVDGLLTQQWRLDEGQVLSAGLTAGSIWFGGEPYADRLRAELALSSQHGPALQSRIGFSVEQQWRASGGAADRALALDLGLQKALASGDAVALRLELGRTLSEDPNQQSRMLGASLRYRRGEPVAGMRLSGGLDLKTRDYPVFFNAIFNDSGRQDRSVSVSADLALPKWEVFGFEPVLSLQASRTKSNVSRYSGDGVGIGFGIQSSF